MAIVAIDYGAKRIGVAVSESELIASPHSVLENRGDLGAVVEALVRIAQQYDAATFLVQTRSWDERCSKGCSAGNRTSRNSRA